MNVNLQADFDPDNVPDEWWLERMRLHRDRLLVASDWTQTTDDPTGRRDEWATYRQALRDFPATWTPGPVVEFPNPPGGN
jgi:hypothetical protein